MAYPFLGNEATVASLVGATVPEVYDIVAASDAIIRAQLGGRLPAATLGMINEYHAAHLFTMGGGGSSGGSSAVQSERLGDYSVSYAVAAADFSDLRATRWGRIVCELDTTGTMAEASKPKPTFAVL